MVKIIRLKMYGMVRDVTKIYYVDYFFLNSL